jgi:PTS system nitrogen regulatory IIA component
LKESIAAFIRLESPIQFDAPDGQPVSLMIFLLVPEQASQQHLDILSELTQMLSDKPFRESLLTATDPHAVHVALTTWEPIRPAA